MPDLIHEGHRERLRAELFTQGEFNAEAPPHKILEFLLFYCIGRKDTNPTAHNLLSRFGSLGNVFDASIEDIAAVSGMSGNSACLLKAIVPIAKLYLKEKEHERPNFRRLEDIGDFALTQYMGVGVERIGLISMSGSGKLLAFEFVADGDVSSVGISFRDVISRLITHKATAAALVHNHPSGVALPSMRDAAITEQLAKTLKNVGVCLVDHIIIGSGDYISMAQSREYAHMFTLSEE